MILRLAIILIAVVAATVFGPGQPARADHCTFNPVLGPLPIPPLDGTATADHPTIGGTAVTCDELVAPVTVGRNPDCSTPEVIALCSLRGAQEIAITNPQNNAMTVSPDVTCTAPGCDGAEFYRVEITVAGGDELRRSRVTVNF